MTPPDHQVDLDTRRHSHTFQVNHPKFREQGHHEEIRVEEEQAEAIDFVQLEALQWDRDQGTDEAEAQGACQDPHQQSVWLQLRGEQGRVTTANSQMDV